MPRHRGDPNDPNQPPTDPPQDQTPDTGLAPSIPDTIPTRDGAQPSRGRGDAKSKVIALTLKVDQLRTQLAEERAHREQLTAAVEKIQRANDHAPPPFHWDDLAADERAQHEQELVKWVQEVLAEWLPEVHEKLRDCWWDHKQLRYHMTTTWLAWNGAFRHAGRTPAHPDGWMRVVVPALHQALETYHGDKPGKCRTCERAES